MVFLGIDPGLHGAVAVLNGKQVLGIYDPPLLDKGHHLGRYDLEQIVRLLDGIKTGSCSKNGTAIEAVVERVHSFPGQGRASMFLQGEGYMMWKAMLVALKIPLSTIPPQTWRKAFFPPTKSELRSGQSIDKALKLFPKSKQFIYLKKHEGRAEALLIAEFCRRACKVRDMF